ncbi:MAG: cell division protein ZapE [Bacteroidia bacterium]|nr:cell division protein ZapE [Bacteroidia bacterium]
MEKMKVPLFEKSELDQYIDEMLDELRKDTEVYEIIKTTLNPTVKMVRDNISKFIAFKEDYDYCRKCPGVDKCTKATPHLQLKLVNDNGMIERVFTPCYKILKRIEVDAKYLYADFPEEWKESTCKTLDKTSERSKVIKLFLQFLEGNNARWLYVKGGHHVGKSFLMATFVNDFIAISKEQAAFINSATRIKELNDLAFTDKDRFARALVELSSVPLLVFDDFGNEYKNDYVRDTIVLPILIERAKNRRMTLFTSDFSISEIAQLYETSKAGAIRAKQLSRLLKEMAGDEFDLAGVSAY